MIHSIGDEVWLVLEGTSFPPPSRHIDMTRRMVINADEKNVVLIDRATITPTVSVHLVSRVFRTAGEAIDRVAALEEKWKREGVPVAIYNEGKRTR